MRNYCWVRQTLSDAGWELCETPFIWHKGNNVGIAPNFRMWPRRSYEVAIFAVRGGRQILHPYAASFASPVEKQYHISEKPIEVLNHFLSMLVNEFTEIFDPTCGSGNALLVAKRLGAKRGLGLDIEQAHVDYTNRQLRSE
jgi:site-specific DNA-methyltransferase (adenine-specific)